MLYALFVIPCAAISMFLCGALVCMLYRGSVDDRTLRFSVAACVVNLGRASIGCMCAGLPYLLFWVKGGGEERSLSDLPWFICQLVILVWLSLIGAIVGLMATNARRCLRDGRQSLALAQKSSICTVTDTSAFAGSLVLVSLVIGLWLLSHQSVLDLPLMKLQGAEFIVVYGTIMVATMVWFMEMLLDKLRALICRENDAFAQLWRGIVWGLLWGGTLGLAVLLCIRTGRESVSLRVGDSALGNSLAQAFALSGALCGSWVGWLVYREQCPGGGLFGRYSLRSLILMVLLFGALLGVLLV